MHSQDRILMPLGRLSPFHFNAAPLATTIATSPTTYCRLPLPAAAFTPHHPLCLPHSPITPAPLATPTATRLSM